MSDLSHTLFILLSLKKILTDFRLKRLFYFISQFFMKNSEINALFKQFLTFLFFLWVHSTFPSTSWNSWIKFRLFSENARINPKDVSISEPAYRAGSAVCGPDPSDQHVQELPQRSRRLIGNFLLCLTSKFPYLSHHFILHCKGNFNQ